MSRTRRITLRGCQENLTSPSNKTAGQNLRKRFCEILVQAGFNIRKTNDGQYKVIFDPFGEQYGWSMIGVLSESHFGVHTYPEPEYGQTVTIVLDLCDLNQDWTPKVQAVIAPLKDFFQAKAAHLDPGKALPLVPYPSVELGETKKLAKAAA